MPTITERLLNVRNSEIVRHQILSAERIMITGHTNPDGDSIGALLSLGIGLESIGKEVHMICHDPIPNKYRHLPGISQIVKHSNSSFDLSIAVDCGSKEMIGITYDVFKKATTTLEIDHHRSRTPFCDFSFVNANASSAGELVYSLLQDLEIPITIEIAQNILTSILVETNSFRLPGISPYTFEICADLLRTGVNFFKLAETVYWVTSKEAALLSGICMSRCQFSCNGQLAWSFVLKKDFRKAGASDTDADPISEKIRSIQGVKVAILFREKSCKELRISFRSKDGINVASIAEKFGGGGHFSAAGCTVPNKNGIIKKVLDFTESIISNYKVNTPAEASIIPEYKSTNHNISISSPIESVLLFDQIIPKEVTTQRWNENELSISLYAKRLEQKIAL